MAEWTIEYTDDAVADLDKLDGSQKPEVIKAIGKVCQNPLPFTEGGYGKPLGNKSANNLHGLLKIVLKRSGIRIVYKLIKEGSIMRIVVIAARKDDYVYKQAENRTETD